MRYRETIPQLWGLRVKRPSYGGAGVLIQETQSFSMARYFDRVCLYIKTEEAYLQVLYFSQITKPVSTSKRINLPDSGVIIRENIINKDSQTECNPL